jgi:hypothetical protein
MEIEDRRKKSEEWDSREKEWTEEMRSTAYSHRRVKPKPRMKKFNPRRRFRFMLVWLGILLTSLVIAFLTVFNPYATNQAIASISSALISGVVFLVNYGKDIAVTIINDLSKNSLR